MLNNPIARHHFTLGRTDYITKKINGHFNGDYGSLGCKIMPATAENFLPMLSVIGGQWGWDNKTMNKDETLLNKRLSDKQTKLFYLLDGDETIGYALITRPSASVQKQILNPFYVGERIIEIENLGLLPGQEGKGRGGKFFEMLFDNLFSTYDYVYWNMSSTNHPGLFSYYKNRIGMMHIGTDYVEDFRPDSLKSQDNQQAA